MANRTISVTYWRVLSELGYGVGCRLGALSPSVSKLRRIRGTPANFSGFAPETQPPKISVVPRNY